MKSFRAVAWLAAGVLTLMPAAAQAQTRPSTNPDGEVAPRPTGPAPANPGAEPDSAGAIRYQGDPRGEKQSETKKQGPPVPDRGSRGAAKTDSSSDAPERAKGQRSDPDRPREQGAAPQPRP